MTEKNKSKLLVISNSFPPLLDASAVLVNNIFSKYEGELYAIGGTTFTKYDPDFKAPCETKYIRFPRNWFFAVLSNYHISFFWVYYFYLLYQVRKIKPALIFGNYPHEVMFVASYKVAKKLKIPFYSYMHDLWEENTENKRRKFASKWEKEVLSNSKRVLCCTEKQQEHYFSKYGIHTDLLHHPIPDEDNEGVCFNPLQTEIKEIAYVGSNSAAMNRDALITLSKAMKYLPDQYKFVWYPIIDMPMDYLKIMGFDTSKIEIRVVSTQEMRSCLKQSAILFAPLSFKNCSDSEVKTVFSNKLLTYFISGRPILVFSPKDSFHSICASKDGWALVVDKDDEKELANQIHYLINNESLQYQIVQKTIEESLRRKASLQAEKLKRWVIEDLIIKN